MCFSPSVPHDNSAQIAEQKEQERQARIKEGQANIDNAFGQFNDNYYGGVSKNYQDYYNPQVDQQYKDALDKLTLQLGQQGILQSSEGNRQITKLQQNYQQQKQAITDASAAASNTAKQQIAQQKTQLYNQNNVAADPSVAAQAAATGAASAVSPPVYSPIGSLFAGLLGAGTNALAVQQGGNVSTGNPNTLLPVSSNTQGISGWGSSGSGSGNVVQ